MPPPPEQHESPEIQPEQDDERFTFSLSDLPPADQWDTAASPGQPYPPMPHDWEASGSGTQTDCASQFVESLFQTPPPPPATYTAEPTDPWSVALTMSAQAEPEEEVTPARRAQAGQLQWQDWRQRNFSRENRGQPPHRFSPSEYI